MSKIICEVCGTRYPDTAEQCPICGYIKENAEVEQEQEVQEEVLEIPERPRVPGGRFSKRNVRKRLKEQAAYAEAEEVSRAAAKEEAYETQDDEDEEDEDEAEAEDKGSTVLNVLLVLVIVALLAVSALVFVRYFMPGFMDKEPETVPTYVEQTEAPTEELTEAPTEEPTEAPTVPCQQLVADETAIIMREAGAMHLLNIQVLPENCTDDIMYISSNEEVATVNEEGRITAVAEGSVVITVVCGEQQLECNVVCYFSNQDATEAPTDAPAETGKTMTVTSTYVNIRSGAGTRYEKVGEYKKGDVVTIYEEKTVGGRPWGRTDKGWICTEYVK